MLYYGKDPAEEEMPKCPCCQEETETLYEDDGGNICGCPKCVKEFFAYEWWKELQESEYINQREMMRYED